MTRLLVALDGGMGRDVVTLTGIGLSFWRSRGWRMACSKKPLWWRPAFSRVHLFAVVMNYVHVRLHEHRVFLGEMERRHAPAVPRKP